MPKPIKTNSEFFDVLREARRSADALRARHPTLRALVSISNQLEAIEDWTTRDEGPTPAEVDSLSMRDIVRKEFEDHPDVELQRLTVLVKRVHSAVKRWPPRAL